MARSQFAWRLVHEAEWKNIQEKGEFDGSAIDIRDGYVHMSPSSEVKSTANIYFAGAQDLWLLRIDLHHPSIKDSIKWDPVPSRNADFPHLYGMKLPYAAVSGSWPVPWDAASQSFNTWPDSDLS